MWNAAFETDFTIHDQIAERDKVVTRITMHAVHNLGDFQGRPPTGKQLEIPELTLERVLDGKIVERWVSLTDWPCCSSMASLRLSHRSDERTATAMWPD